MKGTSEFSTVLSVSKALLALLLALLSPVLHRLLKSSLLTTYSRHLIRFSMAPLYHTYVLVISSLMVVKPSLSLLGQDEYHDILLL